MAVWTQPPGCRSASCSDGSSTRSARSSTVAPKRADYGDIREAHLQVFGAIDWKGTRLTELAARANMTLPAMSELVDDLQRAGYLERRPDPRDGRAKLIRPTRKGRHAIVQALRAVREIEASYSRVVGDERFAVLVGVLQDLVDSRPQSWRAVTSPVPVSSDDAFRPRRT